MEYVICESVFENLFSFTNHKYSHVKKKGAEGEMQEDCLCEALLNRHTNTHLWFSQITSCAGALWLSERAHSQLDRRWQQRPPLLHDDRCQARRPPQDRHTQGLNHEGEDVSFSYPHLNEDMPYLDLE